MKIILLNREEFKQLVFKRDNCQCVVCQNDAVDAHHIIDRSLFENGGYFIDNGVSLCEKHHIEAEQTLISCAKLRELSKIENIIYPENLSLTEFVVDYDKWGNPILKNGKRLKGYIFHQDNVQKILQPVLNLFERDNNIVDKYPRTYHVPSSPGTSSDDRISKNINSILDGNKVITEKLDGSNLKLSQFGMFARSTSGPTRNPWDQYMKPKWEQIQKDLADFNIEICGESMYGIHSIEYSGLKEYFYVFGIKDISRNFWLSWEETEYYASLFDFPTVPVILKTDKKFTQQEFQNLIENDIMKTPSLLSDSRFFESPKEGVVTRLSNEFPCDMFYNSCFKYVRKSHVTTDEHWTRNWRRARIG